MPKLLIIALIITTTLTLIPGLFVEAEIIEEDEGEKIEQELSFWQKAWSWFKENIWLKVKNWTKTEFEKRKEYLRENFQKEKEGIKEEIKTEAPRAGQSLWQRFMDLIFEK